VERAYVPVPRRIAGRHQNVGRGGTCVHQVLRWTWENSAETPEILKTAFGNECSSRARKFEWFTKFKEGRNSGDDDPRPRRMSTGRNDYSATLVRIRANRQLTVREISAAVGIS